MSKSRLDVAVLPSLPPSPSLLDEVFSHPRPWSVRFDGADSPHSSPGSAKGKEKQIIEDEDHVGYPPPMTDDAAETRRVEATLKRWELAERRRRKSARESVHHTSRPSLLSSVTHTASLVLSGRSSISTSTRPSTRTFKSLDTVDTAREGSVPLDDIDIDIAHSSADVIVHSPSHSLFERNTGLDATPGTGTGTRTSEDPFVHPSERAHTPTPLLGSAMSTPTPTPTPTPRPASPPSPSPFGDGHAQQAVQRQSAESKAHGRRSSAGRFSVSPPRPLGIPSPPGDVPHTTPLQPTSQPVLRPPPHQYPEERQEVRWWHDWLCGCSEGPDRGGDNQAGRTNPFE